MNSPLFAAHRILDRLAGMAFDARGGVFGAGEAFAEALAELRRAVPDLVPGIAGETSYPREVSLRITVEVAEGTGAEETSGAKTSEYPGEVESVGDGRAGDLEAVSAGLIDAEGVGALGETALRLAGVAGAAVIRQLSTIAMIAERRLDGYPWDPGYQADLSMLADTPVDDYVGDGAGEQSRWWPSLDRTDIAALVRTSPTVCELSYLRLLDDDLVAHPPPVGDPLSTTGIERVEIGDACGSAPTMTIRGHGFGTAPAAGVGVIAATWDSVTSRVVYRKMALSSWSDTVIVVALPGNAISGTAAFADLNFIADYNTWAKARNRRLNDAMHARGCPGNWDAEVPYEDSPAPVAAAQYSAGKPRVLADVAPTTGPVEQWNAGTLHLRTGQAFRVAWQGFGGDSVTVRALDAGATAILSASGYPSAVTGLNASSGKLVLTATATPVRGTFAVDAINQCGTTRATLALITTGPALQAASVAVFQGIAGGDVEVQAATGGEALNPAGGPTIPLVADKRSVAVIDWWAAVPQMPPGETLTASATLEVHGPLIGHLGVTLRPSHSTADAAPPASDVELPSGPGFASLAAYQQWLAQGNSPRTFNVVLPPEICQGGPIGSTGVPGWLVLEATVRVRSLDGPSWTLEAGNNVTFHPRRRVRIRYRAWGRTTNLSPGEQPRPAPSDQACREALRAAASLLPIPDPQILTLTNSPVEQNGHLIEDLIAERGGTATPSWRDEIWLVVGPVGVGGYAPGPWVGATDATGLTTAHEICHLFAQNHLALCGIAGDPPSSFPNGGDVVVPGYDMWGNAFVRNARDVMVRTYCPEPTWPSPERWRRVFLQVGRP
ncbi:hypothetical protein [Nocardia sp. NPDC127526]|uniref:hypothetical protein n=1 Tax=Nocardia sp. NPDC127526 TaxID=3345393 RepID=UPI00363BD785